MTSDELLNARGMALKYVILDPISDKISELTNRGINKILAKNNSRWAEVKEQAAQNARIRQVYEACKNVQEIGPNAKAKMTEFILTGKEDES